MKPSIPPGQNISGETKIKSMGEQALENIQNYLARQQDIIAVYLFGSFGTEFQNKYSDIDLGVIFFQTSPVDLGRELTLEAELSLLLGTDGIDVVNLNRAPVQLCFKAVSKGTILFEADANALADFLEDTYRMYGDYQVDLKTYYREFREALREAYLND